MASKEEFFKTLYEVSSGDEAAFDSVFDALRGPGTYGHGIQGRMQKMQETITGSDNKQTDTRQRNVPANQGRDSPDRALQTGLENVVRGMEQSGSTSLNATLAETNHKSSSMYSAAAGSKVVSGGRHQRRNASTEPVNVLPIEPRDIEKAQESNKSIVVTKDQLTDKDEQTTEEESESELQRRPTPGRQNRTKYAEARRSKEVPVGPYPICSPLSTIQSRNTLQQSKMGEKPKPLGDRRDPNTINSILRINEFSTYRSTKEHNFSSINKAKKGLSFKLLPRRQRIFKDQYFYFFPNSAVSAARRFRIKKALERGARWVKDWKPYITHIIVDRALTCDEVLKHLKFAAIPTEIVLVNEDYPADCIAFQRLLNPRQSQYLVLKAAVTLTPKTVPQPMQSPSLPLSMQLKPAHKSATATPSPSQRTEELAADQNIEMRMKEIEMQKTAESKDFATKAFEEVIVEARYFENLPLDESQDEESYVQIEISVQDAARANNSKRSLLRQLHPEKIWEDNFACMQKNELHDKSDHPNFHTIEILQKMTDYYERTKDEWRALAYRKAISALRKQPEKVSTKEQAILIPFIGERLAEKIEEIVSTTRLRRWDNAAEESNDKFMQIFLGIYGVGYRQALSWVSQGYRNLEDLRKRAFLTKNQAIGVEHYEDFQLRIPRVEVGRHGELVRETIAKISPQLTVQIGGSYRRGARDCGDIDFIVTSEDMPMTTMRTLFTSELVPRLYAQNYLKCDLTSIQSNSGAKWHGAAAMPGLSNGVWRRVDFLLVPPEEYGAALIYFTGNDIFNRSMRLLASKKGMRLNQHGLYADVLRGPGRAKVTQGTLLEGHSERRIFELLGVPWRRPEHRNC